MLRTAAGSSALLSVLIGVGAFTATPVTYPTILNATRIFDTGILGGPSEALTNILGGWHGLAA